MKALGAMLAGVVGIAGAVLGAGMGVVLFGLFVRFSLWFTELVIGW